MPSFLVEVQYNPGTPRSFAVENVADARVARARVLEIIGYDPGVPVEITQLPINSGTVTRFSNLGRCMD
jgi:hypothetical protein